MRGLSTRSDCPGWQFDGLCRSISWLLSANMLLQRGSLSMFGVRISDPKHPASEKPISSATMMRKFGRFVTILSFTVVLQYVRSQRVSEEMQR